MLGCRLSTVVGSNVIFEDALPSVVAPAIEMLGSSVRLVNWLTSEAGQPHCVASKPKSAGPISSRPIGERRAHIEQRARVERRHRIDHAAVAVLAAVAMIAAQPGNRVRGPDLVEVAPRPARVHPLLGAEIVIHPRHDVREVEIRDVVCPSSSCSATSGDPAESVFGSGYSARILAATGIDPVRRNDVARERLCGSICRCCRRVPSADRRW